MSGLKLAMVAGVALAVAACGGDDLVLPDEGTPAAISIVRGNNQSATVGVTLPDSLVVKVVDGEGRPVPSQSVSFEVVAGGGSVAPGDARTDANGLAGTAWTLGTGAGAQQVLAKPVGNGTPASVQVTFSANAGASSATDLTLLSGDAQTATAGTALPDSLVVRATDASDNPVAGVTVTWTVTGGGAVSATTVATGADGRSAVRRTLGATAGEQSTIATASGLDGSPVTFSSTATVGSAGRLLIERQPSSTASSGTPFVVQPRVQLADANGNPVSTSGISVQAQMVSGPPGATLSGASTATTGGGGLATFQSLGITGPAGSYTLNFVVPNRDDISGSPPTSSISLSAGSASRLAFGTQPSNLSAGGIITPAVTVRIVDAQGNAVTGATNQVTIAFGANPGGATLGGTRTVAAVAGTATFSTLTVDRPGSGYTLQASATGLSGATSSQFNVSTGSAANITNNSSTSLTGTAGSPVSPAPSVKVTDGAGNGVGGVSVTFAVTAGGGSVSGESQTTNAAGIATIGSWVLGTTAGSGNNTLTATSAGLSGSPVTFTASATAGSAGKLTIEGTQPTSGQSGAALTPSFVLQLRDANNNAVATGGITISASLAGGPTATLDGETAITNTQGRATFSSLEINGPSGTYSLTFGGPNLTGVTSGEIVIGSGAATRLDFAIPPSNAVQSGVDFPQQPVVRLEDASGNPVGTAGVTVSITTQTCTGKTLGGTSSLETNSSGEATFTDLRLTGTVGNCTLLFAATGLTTVSSGPIAVGPGPVSAANSSITASPGTITAGGTGSTITVTARDGSNNLIAGAAASFFAVSGGGSFTPGSGATSASGVATSTYTNNAAGAKAIGATIEGVTIDDEAAVTVDPGAADETQSSLVADPASVASSSPSNLTLTLLDQFGNPISGAQVTFSSDGAGSFGANPVATAANGTASTTYTPSAAGTHTLTASAGLVSEETQLSVSAGAVSGATSSLTFESPSVLAYDPAIAGTLALKDAGGNPVAGRDVTFSVDGLGAITPASGTTAADGTIAVEFSGQYFGSNTVTASVEGSSVAPATQVDVLTLPVDPGLSDFTVELQSGGGPNPRAGTQVELHPDPRASDGSFLRGALTKFVYQGTGIMVQSPPDSGWSAGPYPLSHIESISTTIAQTVTVRMLINGADYGMVHTFDFEPDGTSPAIGIAAQSPVSIGETSQVTATLTDIYGNPLPGVSIDFVAPAGSFDPVSAGTDANGVAASVFTPPAAAGTYSVTADYAGGASADVVVTE